VERFNENPRLGARARTKSYELNIWSELRRNLLTISVENIDLGSGDVILRQFANFLE
jgi:hypothetical protein